MPKDFLQRHLSMPTDAGYDSSKPPGDRWAIIIGISEYEDEKLNLTYAHHDAEELYNLIIKPSGGGFEKDHIIKLINEEATFLNINKALRSFLKKPAKDDLVLIYFACHGSPDFDRPNNIYLLPYDTNIADISGTAVPMEAIDTSLKDNLLSDKIVIIADACHSASIGKGIGRGRGPVNSTAAVNRYLENVSKAKGGIALLTSAEANEIALEDEKWGGGHGVFTYYLLEGMRGNADMDPKDGIVSVGELFEYVRERVQKETMNRQHPSIGTNPFDRNLPMAITGGITAQEYFQLGCHLYNLGLALDDKRRLYAANGQFYEAIRLSKLESDPFPEARFQLGRSLMASGDHLQAIKIFKETIKACSRESNNTKIPSEMFLYMAMAYSKEHQYSEAVDSLKVFLDKKPEDENSDWIRNYIKFLENEKTGKKYALLIGVNDTEYTNLKGPIIDVQNIKELLIERLGFEESNITVLNNKSSTAFQSIVNEFNRLAHIVTVDDTMFIYYSGQAYDGDLAYLFPSDVVVKEVSQSSDQEKINNLIENVISPEMLHRMTNQFLSATITLIIDAHSNSKFIDMAEKDSNYTLIVGASPGQLSRDFLFEDKLEGFFTHYLVKSLRSLDPHKTTYGEILHHLIKSIKQEEKDEKSQQIPILVGDKNGTIFSQDYYLRLFNFTQRKNYSLFTHSELLQLYHFLKEKVAASFPTAYYALGLAFLDRKKYESALEALQIATSESKVQYPERILALAISQLLTRNYKESIATLQQYIQLVPYHSNFVQDLMNKIELLDIGQRHALLIGINDYMNSNIPEVKGAINDVIALRKLLVEKFHFEEENITVQLNEQATYNSIIESFDHLVEYSQKAPSLFYFAGNGSVMRSPNLESLRPTIVSADGRLDGVYDIDLSELSFRSSQKNGNLITIIDAGWTANDDRTIDQDKRNRITSRNLISVIGSDEITSSSYEFDELMLKIGLISIYAKSIKRAGSSLPVPNEKEFTSFEAPDEKEYRGVLTHALIEELIKKSTTDNTTYSQLSKALSRVGAKIVGDQQEVKLFSNFVLEDEVIQSLVRMEKYELIDKTIILLRRLIEQRKSIYPEGYLNLGIAYAAKGEYNKSIENMEIALAQKNNNYSEASYYLGRVLYESENEFAKAVGLLRQVIIDEPDNISAHYYLGQSIRSLIEKETLVEAEKVIRTYLENGAPMGHKEELWNFLKSIKDKKSRVTI